MSSSLVVAGHSHAIALGVMPDAGSPPGTLDPIEHGGATVVGLVGPWPRDEAYWSALETVARDRSVAIVWDGNQHQANFLIERNPPLDFVLSSDPELPLDPRASYVAEAQLRAFFESSIAPLADIVARVAAITPGRVMVVGTPPPSGDVDAIRTRAASEPIFVRAATEQGGDIATIALTTPATMLKLWRLIQDMLHETAVAAGGAFVPVPDSVRTGEGFLKPEHATGDVTQASAAYGRVLLEAVVAASAQGATA